MLTGAVGKYWLGYSWDDLYEGLADSLLMGLQAILILFIIYGLIATWVSAGTIPGLMYYGLSILTPDVFLPTTALLRWSSPVLLGRLDDSRHSWRRLHRHRLRSRRANTDDRWCYPLGCLRGRQAVSPLRHDNLAAAVTNTDLYDHIRAMRNGTVLAFGLSVLLYAVLGLRAVGEIPTGRVAEIQGALAGSYDLSVLVLLPLIVTFGLALYGIPALPTLVAGVFAGAFTTIFVQGRSFTAAWTVFLDGTAPETGTALVNDLLASGGISGSAWTIAVVVAALSLGGLLERTGVLAVLAHDLATAVRGPRSLVVGTGVSAIFVNASRPSST